MDCSRVPASITTLDHHRPGDRGYGRPPAEYLTASSIGQVLMYCAPQLMALYHAGCEQPEPFLSNENDSLGCRNCNAVVYVVPRLRLIAAADHCLGAAYRGQCPGVDPNELMVWRAESRAQFQRRATEMVLADIERARAIVQRAKNLDAVTEDGYPTGKGLGVTNAPRGIANLLHPDKRWLVDGVIPELPEAAAREGRAYITTIPGPGGRTKVVLQCAEPQHVRWFLEEFPAVEKYGDPERGFAGGLCR
jgi:hypothetical protein